MHTHGVTVRSVRALRGPNIWTDRPALQIVLDSGPYEDRPSDTFPGFTERLIGWLPGLHAHECESGRPGAFVECLRTGTSLGHIAVHVTLDLQNLMGFDAGFGRTHGTGEHGVYNVVIGYVEEEPARAAFEVALRLTVAALHDEPFDIPTELERLMDLAGAYHYGASMGTIVEAARARDIPVLRLTAAEGLVQLGYGVHQQRIQEVNNRDPRRRPGHSASLSRIRLDEAAEPAAQALATLYPPGAPARIPIVAVTGTNGKTTVVRLIAHIYEAARKIVGMTTTEGTYIAGELTIKGDCSGPRNARAVLLHPRVEVAVLETARGGILREGLAFDTCSVGVVTNISSDHLGLDGVNTLEDLARVKQVVVKAVAADGAAVLNAEDPLVVEMGAACRGRTVYFGGDPQGPVLAAHRAAGGEAVSLEDGAIVLAAGGAVSRLVELDRIGFTIRGRIPFQVQNALAATAAAWAAGLTPAQIVRGLTTFQTDAATVPGRFNLSEIEGVQIVADYAHNPAALTALGQAVRALGPRHTILALNLPGDRRDEDLIASVDATRSFADEYVLFDAEDRRGRAPDEVPRLLLDHLPAEVAATIEPDQEAAIRRAWSRARRGDRMVIILDEVDRAIQILRRLKESTGRYFPVDSLPDWAADPIG